jgi:hypothetical protein
MPLRRHWQAALTVATFCVLGVLLYGGSPLASGHLPSCACGDVAQEVWFLAWPAYALAHGLNPLFSGFAAYPRGINLMANTSMPLLGLLSSPVSASLGPVAAYNLLARLGPILSATSLLFVLRRWVRWWPAAFAGGLLYGFSPFLAAEGNSHLFLTFLPLPPLMLALLDDLVVRRRRRPVLTGALLGLVAAAQLLISAEVLAITLLAAVAGVALAALRHPEAVRARLAPVGAGIGSALAVFALVAGYPLFMYLAGPQHVTGPHHPQLTYYLFHDDLLGTVIPTSLQALGLASWKARGDLLAQGNLVDHANFFGVPLLVILTVFAIRYRRAAGMLLAALLGAGSLILTLGPTLYVDGTAHLTALRLPYDWLWHVPVLDGLLAPRFVLLAYLAAAVMLAVGLDRLRGDLGRSAPASRWAPAACVGVGVIALVPLLPSGPFSQSPLPVPSLFRKPAVIDRRIPPGSVLLPYPNAQEPSVDGIVVPWVRSMLWQAVAGMRFRMIGAYAAQPSGAHLGQGDELLEPPRAVGRFFGWALYGPRAVPGGGLTGDLPRLVRVFCLRHRVATVVVDPHVGFDPAAVVRLLASALGHPPLRLAGVDAWFDVGSLLAPSGSRRTIG